MSRVVLNVTFPTSDMDDWVKKNDLVSSRLGYPDSAGTMLLTGERDMQWKDMPREVAGSMKRLVESLQIEGLVATILT
jgi:hypothetical protein